MFFQTILTIILKAKNLIFSPYYMTNFLNGLENMASVFRLGLSKMVENPLDIEQ